MSAQSTATTAPLDDVMLAMDVVDTLRHRQDLVTRELSAEGREAQLIEKLRGIYAEQGITVPDHILAEGVAALSESRFAYTPPQPSLARTLARLYVSRRKWAPATFALALVAVLGLGGYFFVWQPYQAAQVEQGRVELSQGLPAQMDQLYQTIFEETKVQQASMRAAELVQRGKAASAEGDRAGALKAVGDLTHIRDTLRLEYSLRVVNRSNEDTGFWRFPDNNTDATNYYIVVEALDPDGNNLALPILSEETGKTETVSNWGLRVPESVYRSVANDKRDDGIVQRNLMGRKDYGYLDVKYVVPTSGAAVTHWQ